MSDLTTQILAILADQLQIASGGKLQSDGTIKGGHLGGHGHALHDGQEIRCIGTEDVDGLTIVGSRHILGSFVVDADHKAEYSDAAICVGNAPLHGSFVLADGATFDPENPVCHCGQPFTLY